MWCSVCELCCVHLIAVYDHRLVSAAVAAVSAVSAHSLSLVMIVVRFPKEHWPFETLIFLSTVVFNVASLCGNV